MDFNLVKRIRVSETKNVEIRMDVIDILNTPYWNNPTVDINSTNFGRMDAADVTTGFSNADNRKLKPEVYVHDPLQLLAGHNTARELRRRILFA